MTQHDPKTKATLLSSQLAQFTSDLYGSFHERIYHPVHCRVIYTPGVDFLAEQAGASWLVDVIASWIGSHSFNRALKQDERLRSFHVWRLEVDRETASAVLMARPDSGEPAFITQRIPFTDFPLESIDIWCGFDGRHWTLYLPSEH